MLNSLIKYRWVPVMRGSCENQAFRWTQNQGCSSQVTPRNIKRLRHLDNQKDSDGPQTNNQDGEQGLSWEHYPRLEPGKEETGLTVRSWPNLPWPPLLHVTLHPAPAILPVTTSLCISRSVIISLYCLRVYWCPTLTCKFHAGGTLFTHS